MEEEEKGKRTTERGRREKEGKIESGGRCTVRLKGKEDHR